MWMRIQRITYLLNRRIALLKYFIPVSLHLRHSLKQTMQVLHSVQRAVSLHRCGVQFWELFRVRNREDFPLREERIVVKCTLHIGVDRRAQHLDALLGERWLENHPAACVGARLYEEEVRIEPSAVHAALAQVHGARAEHSEPQLVADICHALTSLADAGGDELGHVTRGACMDKSK